MEECKKCELAVYCYSDSNSWIFRTKQEMKEKQAAMAECSTRRQAKKTCVEAAEKCSCARVG